MSNSELNAMQFENNLYISLINDKDFVNEEWDEVCLVFSDSGSSCFGYRFFSGNWSAFGPKSFDWAEPAMSLHEKVLKNNKSWLKMLMCLNKEKNSFTTEYEFEDADRWSLGGKDIGSIEEFAYSLKRD